MSYGLKIRAYRLGDEIQILRLFRQSYGRDLDRKVWFWRFQDNPAGQGIIYLGWDKDTLAAHYGVSAVVMRISGWDWLTGLSGTTMTHPDYRGQGLFPKLARKTYDQMRQAGMAMVWGFPNTQSHRGFVRDLEWVDIYEIPTLRLALPGHRLLPVPPPTNILELQWFDGRFDQLWEQVRDDYRIIAKRDRDYLQWRYVKNPVTEYHILAYVDGDDVMGYAVYKRYREELQIVDILTRPDIEIGLTLISRLVQIGLEQSLSSVGLWLNVSHPLHRALERLGFYNDRPVIYFGGLSLQSHLQETEIYDFRNWYLTMGDSDVF